VQRKIRVLETIWQGRVGGGETHVIDLVQALNKNLFEPIVLSFTSGPMVDRLMAMGIRTHVLETERRFSFTRWRRVKQLLRAERIDLVHAHGTRAHSNTFWAARQLGLPIIYTVHGWSFHPGQPLLIQQTRRLTEKLLLDRANRTICVSESNYRGGLEFSDMSRAVVIKNGIDLQRFNPSLNMYNVRAELDIASDVLLVGYIAHLTAQKGLLTLLRAVALLPSSLKVKFLVAGDGALKGPAQELARQLKIESRVIFTGSRQDVPDLLQALDIYCLPSRWESLSSGILEAMAMGKPVIASSIDATCEVIKHGVNGLLVPVNAPEKLATAIQQLAASRELRHALGARAYQTIHAGFTAEEMTQQVERLYLEQVPQRAAAYAEAS
jgi:glycosyltransferase involved in cell wall biosynthesis